MVDFSQKQSARKIEFSGFRIVVAYLVVAGLWIVGSDRLLAWIVSDPQKLTWLQTGKGWLFVIVTGALLFALIRRQMIAQWNELESYRVTLDQSPVGVAHVSLDGRCIRVNRALCRFLGYPHDELVRMTFLDLTSGDDIDADLANSERLLAGEIESFTMEKRYLRKDGQLVWGELAVTLARDNKGEPLYFISLVSDIDRRKKAEQRLRESEQRYRVLFEKNPHPMWVFDAETLRFLAVNDAAVVHYGYSREEFLAMTIADIRPPEDVGALRGVVGRKEEGVDHSGVWRHYKKDGTLIFVEIVTHALNFAGRPAEMVLAHDVTEERLAHAALKKNEEMLRAVFEGTTDAVYVKDLAGYYQTINPAGAGMVGMNPEEVIGRDDLAVFGREKGEEVGDIDRQVMEGGRTLDFGETAFVNGRNWYFHTTKIPFRDQSGGIVGVVGVSRDVTETKEAEEELKRLNRVLRVLSKGNEALIRARDEQTLFDSICENLVEVGGYRFAWIGLGDADAPRDLRIRAVAGPLAEGMEELQELFSGVSDKPSPSIEALSSGEVVAVPSFGEDPRYSHLKELARRFDVGGGMSLPLESGGQRLGVLTIYSAASGRFDAEEVGLLSELAEDVGYGIVSLRTEEARLEAERGLHLRHRAIEASNNGIVICDFDGENMEIIYTNPAFERMTGYGEQEVSGKNPEFLAGSDRWQKGLIDLRGSLGLGHSNEAVIRFYRRGGEMFWGEVSAAPVFDAKDRISHSVIVINDVTERKRYEEQLEHQSSHDTLTELANRHLLQDRLTQSLVYAERSKRIVAVMLLDLDRFKLINDSLGHRHGDELLRLVAERLSGCVRAGDTVARLGGDEFVITLTEVAEFDDVSHLARKVQQSLSRSLTLADRELHVTASIGISLYPRDGVDSETLIRNADIAMYRAKEKGGNTFGYFAPEMNVRVVEALAMESDLRRALDRREFVLHFQPKVDLRSGRILGCEALVRWRHPERGMVSPGAFIPLAEEIGLISPIGRWVLQEACRCNRRWQQGGLDPGTVSVNLSARQFSEEDLPAVVEQTLLESGLDAGLLELELTESMVMGDPEGAVETMRRLKGLGVGLSLDDFGTGYSSLNYLRRFPVDTLKIDRSFIIDVVDSPSGASVTTSVIAIAHSLGLTAVAEGVETAEQLRFLRKCRCDAFQGFYFSKPVPADEFEALLREGRKLEM